MNPSVRGGLGLSYLLLGISTMTEEDGVGGPNDDSAQLIFQSIQHLKAATGLTMTVSKDDDEIASVRAAVMHNLGLAYMTLDEMGGQGAKGGLFSEWTASLRSSSFSTTESWAYRANEGASLLQLGRIEDAITSLESVADGEACSAAGSSLASSSRRKEEVCRITRQNLAVAQEALSGETVEPSIGTTIYDEVVRWNANAASSVAGAAEQGDDATIYHPLEVEAQTPDDEVEEVDGSSDPDGAWARFETRTELNDDVAVGKENKERSQSHIEQEKEGEDSIEKEGKDPSDEGGASKGCEVKAEPKDPAEEEDAVPRTPMQDALAALERAAGGIEGAPRARLLLALARARSAAGDGAGAVDAAVRAVGAAESEGEAEASTAYLESLVKGMAPGGAEGEEERDAMPPAVPEEPIPRSRRGERQEEEASAFIERRDFALSELQLKLELEKLKNKVLEQEVMLGRYQRRQHLGLGYDEEEFEALRAIDYRRRDVGEDDTILLHDPPSRRRDSKDIKRSGESIIVSKTTEDPIDEEPMATEDVAVEEDLTESTPVTQKNETGVVSTNQNISMAGNETAALSESQDIETETFELDEGSATTAAMDDGNTEPQENQTVAATNSEQEEKPIELPTLYQPEKKEPNPMP